MTVKELIIELQSFYPDTQVILQKDSEGNAYSPLSGVEGENLVYVPDSTYSGGVKFKKFTPELRQQGYSYDDVGDGESCVVLYPIN